MIPIYNHTSNSWFNIDEIRFVNTVIKTLTTKKISTLSIDSCSINPLRIHQSFKNNYQEDYDKLVTDGNEGHFQV